MSSILHKKLLTIFTNFIRYKKPLKNAGQTWTCVLIVTICNTLRSKYFDCRQNYSNHCEIVENSIGFVFELEKSSVHAQYCSYVFKYFRYTITDYEQITKSMFAFGMAFFQLIVILRCEALFAKYVVTFSSRFFECSRRWTYAPLLLRRPHRQLPKRT